MDIIEHQNRNQTQALQYKCKDCPFRWFGDMGDMIHKLSEKDSKHKMAVQDQERGSLGKCRKKSL